MKMSNLTKCLLSDDNKSLQYFKKRVELLKTEDAITAKENVVKFSYFLNTLIGKGLNRLIVTGLTNRSKRIAGQIAPYLIKGNNVLDLGCGDGKVSEELERMCQVKLTLSDVVDYNKTELPFYIFNGKKLPFGDCSFETVNLITVLHHAIDPISILEEAIRVCKMNGRIMVIESTYFNLFHRTINSLLDWFYNNVLNDPDIPVPLNFMTSGAWKLLFEERGLKVCEVKNLGIDQPLVPEWHVLYVLEKQNG